MTRSTKKAIVSISKPRDASHRRRERHKVKEILRIDPDSDMLNADSRELGGDEWGTKFDLEFDCDENWEEEKKKFTRK